MAITTCTEVSTGLRPAINNGVNNRIWPMLAARRFMSMATTGVTVDGAKVLTADIACSNGVIHVIDAVLLQQFARERLAETLDREEHGKIGHPSSVED